MTDGSAGPNRLDAFARRLARRRRGGSVAPVPKEVLDEMVRDLDMRGGEAEDVLGGATSHGTKCGYNGYYCPPGYYRCINGVCYP